MHYFREGILNEESLTTLKSLLAWAFSGVGLLIIPLLFKRVRTSISKLLGFISKRSNDNSSASPPTKTTCESVKEDFQPENLDIDNDDPKEDSYVDSCIIFNRNLSANFPGIRGIKEFNYTRRIGKKLTRVLNVPSEIAQRQNIIWWFRGTRNNSIDSFKHIFGNMYLMNHYELRIKKIVIFNSSVYWQSFIYVETKPSKPTGLYKYTKNDIDHQVLENGYIDEEYGLYKHLKMSRHNYDDAAIEILGKSISTNGKDELRVRYITSYNLIICAHNNPINDSSLDNTFEDILNGILRGENDVREIAKIVVRLPRRMNYRY